MKKIKYAIFAFAVFLTLQASAMASSSEDLSGIYQLENSLNLLPEEGYNTDEFVTRSEFAYIASKLLGNDEEIFSREGEEFYSDVKADVKYSKNINALSRLGMVKGFSDGLFEPEYSISYTDVSYTFVKILGFDDEAELNGGYPTGYIKKAAELKLYLGVDTKKYITKSDMIVILDNVLNSKRKIVKPNNGYIFEINYDATILYDVFSITKITGLVNSNSITSIYENKGVGDGNVKIADTVYSVGQTAGNDFLGHFVTCYVRWNKDDGTLVSISDKKTNVVKILDEDINKKSTMSTIVSDEGSSGKNYKIAPDVCYIFNGKYSDGLKVGDVIIDSGFIELIDNNQDNVYEIIVITKYETFFAEKVSALNENISAKYNKSLKLEGKNYKIYKNNQSAQLVDISTNDILNVVIPKDNDDYVIFVTSGEYVSGSISGVKEDKIIIGGDEYSVNLDYSQSVTDGFASKLTLGLEGVFYLDIMGKIAGYGQAANEERSELYGFLIKITGSYDEDGVFIKLLCEDGEVRTYSAARKIRVDGTGYNGTLDFITNITQNQSIRQIIRYKLNANEEIFQIDTPYVSENEDEKTSLTMGKTSTLEKNTWWVTALSNAEGRFFMSQDTLVFQVPQEGDDAYDMDLYSVGRRSLLANGSECKMAAYDMSDDYVASCVVKYLEKAGEVSTKDKVIIVCDVATQYDEKNNMANKQVTDQDGKEYVISKSEKGDGVKIGDVLQIVLDSKNQIKGLKTVIDASRLPSTFSFGTEWDSPHVYRAEIRYSNFVILESHGTRFVAALFDEAGNIDDETKFIYEYTGKVIVYDSKKKEITVSDDTEIPNVLYGDNPNIRVFVRQVYGGLSMMYIYK